MIRWNETGKRLTGNWFHMRSASLSRKDKIMFEGSAKIYYCQAIISGSDNIPRYFQLTEAWDSSLAAIDRLDAANGVAFRKFPTTNCTNNGVHSSKNNGAAVAQGPQELGTPSCG
jgi:hypothetical protein